MNTNNNTERLFDTMESGRSFDRLTEEERELVLIEFGTIESYNSAVEFNSKTKNSLQNIEDKLQVKDRVKQNLLEKFREKNDQKNVRQGSIIGFTPTLLGFVKIGLAASMVVGSMVLPEGSTLGGEVLAADSTLINIDTTLSSIDTSVIIKDTIAYR